MKRGLMMCRATGLALALWGGAAWAQDSAFARAVAAISDGPAAALAALPSGEALPRDLLEWLLLRRSDTDLPPARAQALIDAHPTWPGLARLRRLAEEDLTPDTPAAEGIALFLSEPPQTASGALWLARAYRQVGDAAAAQRVIRAAWQSLPMSIADQAATLAEFGPSLTAAHWTRTDEMLWQGRADDARRMIPLLSEADKLRLAARLAYLDDLPQAGALDAALRPEPGLAFARFGWLSKHRKWDDAAALMLARSSDAQSLGRPGAWATPRRSLARRMMRAGQGALAYALAAGAQTTAEDGYAHYDLLWLAGFIALEHEGDPARAAAHFDAFAKGLSTPVSLGRAGYWQARAAARRAEGTAQAALRAAAAHQVSFYGQLSADALDQPLDATLAGAPAALAPPTGELAQAALLLIDAGQIGAAYLFVSELADTAPPEALHAMTAQLLAREQVFLALRLGKRAAARGVMIPEAYLPLHPLADLPMSVDPALALAIARQESEFRTDAGSPVGALGLMQLMPATAQRTARQIGLPYAKAQLPRDWRYNAQLGTAHLQELTDQFGPSPVLVAAAYNAGAGRARDWIARFGDPRDPSVDPVLWIEQIPFRETRNYVMRVTEAIRPYQLRLGRTPAARFDQVLRGAYPLRRPRLRPDDLGQPDAPTQSEARGQPSVLRPRARPVPVAQ